LTPKTTRDVPKQTASLRKVGANAAAVDDQSHASEHKFQKETLSRGKGETGGPLSGNNRHVPEHRSGQYRKGVENFVDAVRAQLAKLRREKSHKTRAWLADQLGVVHPTVSKWFPMHPPKKLTILELQAGMLFRVCELLELDPLDAWYLPTKIPANVRLQRAAPLAPTDHHHAPAKSDSVPPPASQRRPSSVPPRSRK
jgi:hypothetical protein